MYDDANNIFIDVLLARFSAKEVSYRYENKLEKDLEELLGIMLLSTSS